MPPEQHFPEDESRTVIQKTVSLPFTTTCRMVEYALPFCEVSALLYECVRREEGNNQMPKSPFWKVLAACVSILHAVWDMVNNYVVKDSNRINLPVEATKMEIKTNMYIFFG